MIDAAMKFIWVQPSDVVSMVTGAAQGQPGYVHQFYSFWISSVTYNPTAFLYGIGTIEMALGFALVVGFLRKTAYIGGIVLAIMIWAVDEGFGGPYGPGSTDIGAAIMYALVFAGIVILERSANYGRYSLDALIVRKWNAWRHVSELYSEKSIPGKSIAAIQFQSND